MIMYENQRSTTRHSIGAIEENFPDLYSTFVKLMEEAVKNGLTLRTYGSTYGFLDEAAVQQEDKERKEAK